MSLLVVKGLPEPPRGGEDLRNRQAAAALAELGPVTVFGLAGDAGPTDGSVEWLRASDRSLGAPSGAGALAWLSDPHGHQSDLWFSESAAAELAEVVRERDPDVVVLATLWL